MSNHGHPPEDSPPAWGLVQGWPLQSIKDISDATERSAVGQSQVHLLQPICSLSRILTVWPLTHSHSLHTDLGSFN